MVTARQQQMMKNRLVKTRDQLVHRLDMAKQSLDELQEPVTELEEMAERHSHSLKTASYKELLFKEMEGIDAALARMASDAYGICQLCGDNISWKRLRAVPWTPFCIGCAGGAFKSRPPEAEEQEDESANGEGSSDGRLLAQILETLRQDGRVELDELQIDCRDGAVTLIGALSGEKSHKILVGILSDGMGIEQIEDNIRLDPVLWSDEADEEPDETLEKTDDEVILQGEDEEDDAYAAFEESESVIPPDTMAPERGK